MRTDAVRVGGLFGFAALVVSGAAVAFERASADVMTAAPAEYTTWVVTNHAALLTQSLLFVTSSGLLLLLFGGVRALLDDAPALARTVLAAGAVWVAMSLTAQTIQVAMARAARDGVAPGVVATLGDLMTVLLLVANLPLAIVLAAVALAGLREPALREPGLPEPGLPEPGLNARRVPTWLGWVSAAAALLHLVPLLSIAVADGPMSPDGLVGFLPYPAFVVWLVAVSVVMVRAPARDRARVAASHAA